MSVAGEEGKGTGEERGAGINFIKLFFLLPKSK